MNQPEFEEQLCTILFVYYSGSDGLLWMFQNSVSWSLINLNTLVPSVCVRINKFPG